MHEDAVKKQVIALNPHLAEDRFTEQISVDLESYL